MGKARESDGEGERLVAEATQSDSDESPGGWEGLKAQLTGRLVLAIAAAIGSSLQFGFNIGVVNAPQQLVQAWINETETKRTGKPLSAEAVVNIWSVIVSLFPVGGMVGALSSGFVADRLGRKGGMLLNNVLALTAASLFGFSKVSGTYALLVVGRLVVGVSAGLSSGLAPMYLTEVAPQSLRGAIGSLNQLGITVAIFLSQVLGLSEALGTAELWPVLFGCTAVLALYQLATLPFCPESPKYSYVVKGREAEAEQENVAGEMRELRLEAAKIKALPKVRFLHMFTDGKLRWPLVISVVLMVAQQLSGINAVMYYSTEIFLGAGLKRRAAVWATLGVGAINVVVTVVSVGLVERLGRRTLLLGGLSGCLVSLAALTAVLNVRQPWAPAVGVVLVYVFVMSFAPGLGPIPWFFVSELFATSARGHATSIAAATNWLCASVVGQSFLPLKNAMKEWVFLIFASFVLGCAVFVWFFAPETKDKSKEEIDRRLAEQGVCCAPAEEDEAQ